MVLPFFSPPITFPESRVRKRRRTWRGRGASAWFRSV